MRRVRETQSLISAAIEPGGENSHLSSSLSSLVSSLDLSNDFLFFFSFGVQAKTVKDARGPGPGPNPGGGVPARGQDTGDGCNPEVEICCDLRLGRPV